MNSGEVPAEFLHPCARPVSERGRAMVRDRHVFVACFCCVFLLGFSCVCSCCVFCAFLARVVPKRVSCKKRHAFSVLQMIDFDRHRGSVWTWHHGVWVRFCLKMMISTQKEWWFLLTKRRFSTHKTTIFCSQNDDFLIKQRFVVDQVYQKNHDTTVWFRYFEMQKWKSSSFFLINEDSFLQKWWLPWSKWRFPGSAHSLENDGFLKMMFFWKWWFCSGWWRSVRCSPCRWQYSRCRLL